MIADVPQVWRQELRGTCVAVSCEALWDTLVALTGTEPSQEMDVEVMERRP